MGHKVGMGEARGERLMEISGVGRREEGVGGVYGGMGRCDGKSHRE